MTARPDPGTRHGNRAECQNCAQPIERSCGIACGDLTCRHAGYWVHRHNSDTRCYARERCGVCGGLNPGSHARCATNGYEGL